jgi:hypothetical protein
MHNLSSRHRLIWLLLCALSWLGGITNGHPNVPERSLDPDNTSGSPLPRPRPPPPAAEVRALQQFCASVTGCSSILNWQLQISEEVQALEDPCQSGWVGVGCYHDVRSDVTHITSVDLPRKQLSGPCSTALLALQALPHLSHLVLYGNLLSGTIPRLILLTQVKDA